MVLLADFSLDKKLTSLNLIHKIEAINLFLLVFKTVFVKMRRNGMYLSTLRFLLYLLFIFITALPITRTILKKQACNIYKHWSYNMNLRVQMS